ncbi:MAG: YHS domain-containing protein [Spirosomataceae bacterium]
MKNVILILTLSVVFISYSSFQTVQEPAKKETKSTELQKDGTDPVCGMKVKKGSKLVADHKEKQYGFCSKSCQERFTKNPEKYVKP